MKKNLKTNKVRVIYNIISQAKYGKLADEDKIKVWKIARLLKPISDKFEEDSKDAAEKMKPMENFDDILRKAQEYEHVKQNGGSETDVMTEEEYNSFIEEFKKYNKLVGDAIKEFADEEVELDFEPLKEDAFGKLMASNEWSMTQAMEVGDLICE